MTEFELQKFFPEQLKIKNIFDETTNRITIDMESDSEQAVCPLCGVVSGRHHGTYIREPLIKSRPKG